MYPHPHRRIRRSSDLTEGPGLQKLFQVGVDAFEEFFRFPYRFLGNLFVNPGKNFIIPIFPIVFQMT